MMIFPSKERMIHDLLQYDLNMCGLYNYNELTYLPNKCRLYKKTSEKSIKEWWLKKIGGPCQCGSMHCVASAGRANEPI